MVRARLALIALVLAAAPLGAQEISDTAASAAVVPAASAILFTAPAVSPATQNAGVAVAGPTLDAARSGFHAPASALPMTPVATRANLGQARAMMIVGGAALLAGAIIGDTAGAVIMVGGAVVGLVGLYEYLQ